MIRFALAILASLAALAGAPAALAQPRLGGPGGAPFRLVCPPGSFVQQIELSADAEYYPLSIESIVCAGIDENGRPRETRTRATLRQHVGGGTGPIRIRPSCDSGSELADGMAGLADLNRNGFRIVAQLVLRCKDVLTGATAAGAIDFRRKPGSVYAEARMNCRPDPGGRQMYVNGITGGAGLYIDGVAILCAPGPGILPRDAPPRPVARRVP